MIPFVFYSAVVQIHLIINNYLSRMHFGLMFEIRPLLLLEIMDIAKCIIIHSFIF